MIVALIFLGVTSNGRLGGGTGSGVVKTVLKAVWMQLLKVFFCAELGDIALLAPITSVGGRLSAVMYSVVLV